MKVFGFVLAIFWVNRFTGVAPAVSTRKANSSKYSLDFFSFCSWVITPTNTAFSPEGTIFIFCDIGRFYGQTAHGILLNIKAKAIR